MAMTSGVLATDGSLSVPIRSGLSRAVVFCRSSWVQDDAAGDHTSGRAPSTEASQPRASASAAPPLALLTTATWAHLPSTLVPFQSAAIWVSSAAFSDEADRWTVVQSLLSGAALGPPLLRAEPLSPPPPVSSLTPTIRASPTTAATTSGARLVPCATGSPSSVRVREHPHTSDGGARSSPGSTGCVSG